MEAGPPIGVVRDGSDWIVGERPSRVVIARGNDAFAALDEISTGGFWIGFVAYDLGRAIEDVVTRTDDDLALPDLAFVRFERAVRTRRRPALRAPGSRVALGAGRSSLTRAEHAERVDAVRELLRAGDCYQVNLTRRLAFERAVDPRALFDALTARDPAPHAGVCTFGAALPDVGIVSASPELFLRVEGHHVETRPIKGTARDERELRASAKDRAEHVMIVDLARNDLGRVCEFGSVRVPQQRVIETRPGLHHLVSSVQGTLRAGIGLSGLLRATFPPASVTGAPKPRVLQAIEDLEPVRRGAYCGAFGWIDADHERAELAVAIRTFTIAGTATYFGVGGGIVADSRAELEWAETELKAARLLGAAGGTVVEPVVVP